LPSTPSSAPSDDDLPRSRRARWILAGIAVVVVVAIGAVTWAVIAGSGGDDSSSATSRVQQADVADQRDGGPQVGDPVPDFTATTLDGKTVHLSDYAGQPVVLNFWASWCNPCREEFPLFREEQARRGDDYVMLGVDNRDIESDAKTFAKEQRARWPIAFDGSNAIYKAYGVARLPQTFFIRPDGTVALRYYAPIPNQEKFDEALAKITVPAAPSS
jgi:cytochrome c biogenesis protein CcmG/thiol:disulfide interchange protein DsbE